MASKRAIQTGDRFARRDNPATIWVVSGLAKLAISHPLHYYLQQERPPHRRIVISEAALRDRNLYAWLGGNGSAENA